MCGLAKARPAGTKAAVQAAFAQIGRRGFILGAGPSIKTQRPVENVRAMFDAWCELR